MTWTQAEAIELCRLVEAIAPDHGCHVALTGGLLYKDGERKDCDLLFYRIRQVDEIDVVGLFGKLRHLIGIEPLAPFDAWCVKAKLNGKAIDCFFPEAETGDEDYDPNAVDKSPDPSDIGEPIHDVSDDEDIDF